MSSENANPYKSPKVVQIQDRTGLSGPTLLLGTLILLTPIPIELFEIPKLTGNGGTHGALITFGLATVWLAFAFSRSNRCQESQPS